MIDRNNSSPFLTHPGENSYFASSLLNPESRKANELSMDSLMVPGLTSDDMQRIKESLISNFAQGNTDNNNEGSAYDEILKNEIRTSHSTSNLVDPLQSFNMNLSFKQEAFKSHSQISSINHSKTNSMESTASFLLKEHSVKNTLGLNINKAQDGSSIYSETSTEAHSPVNSYSSPKSHAEDSNHLRSHKTRDSISTMQTTTTISSKKERTILFHCKALFPYKASGPTELSLVPGIDLNVFKVTKNSSSPWWYGEDAFSRERGWFPSGYCKRI
ncbi:hypothetical protein K502DRAFT_82276 [Neoconidiobolus thromboides FSU 785]|nr:hypothetical protein K502DRAFT_82276 [Neoconidiobolus thromboides FSU 785]